MTVPADEQLVEEFLSMTERHAKTLHKYGRHLVEFRCWLTERADGKSLLEVNKPDVMRFVADLKNGHRFGETTDGRPLVGALSPSGRKSVISALRSFYNHCDNLYQLRYDPTHGIKTPKVTVNRGVSLNREEVRGYLDAPGTERDRVQAYLAVFTAARAGSLRDLRWPDVDFDQELLHFNAKFENHYTLPLHPQLRAALLRYRDWVFDEAGRNPHILDALRNPDTAYVLLTQQRAAAITLGAFQAGQVARCPGRHPPPSDRRLCRPREHQPGLRPRLPSFLRPARTQPRRPD